MKLLSLTTLAVLMIFTMISNANAMSYLNSCALARGNYDASFSENDVTFRGNDADECAGIFNGNDMTNGGLAGNTALDNVFGGSWSLFLNSDDNLSDTLAGSDLTFTLSSFPAEETSGDWSLQWSGTHVPVEMDLVAVVKAGDGWAAYLFEDEIFDTSFGTANGTWSSIIQKDINNKYVTQSLSHFSLYVRDVNLPEVPAQVPAPSTLALLGLGLLGIGFRRRSKVS